MKMVLALYWVGAYTAGVACLSFLAFRWLHWRDTPTARLLAFLGCMGLSMTALALREAIGPGRASGILGAVALVGGGLCAGAFPRYAASISGDAPHAAPAAACGAAGLGLAVLDAAAALLADRRPALVAGLLTMVSLIASVILSLSWIRAARGGGRTAHRAGKAFFAAAAGLVVFLDFLGGWSLFLPAPATRLILFPACYGLLSAWLLASHLASWLAGSGATPPAAGTSAKPGLAGGAAISPREAEVAALLAEGLTYREIAERLYVSVATIKSHLSHLYAKTGARNKIELLNSLRGSD
jgi:DNA-binding CsgD family transcriptional regulator